MQERGQGTRAGHTSSGGEEVRVGAGAQSLDDSAAEAVVHGRELVAAEERGLAIFAVGGGGLAAHPLRGEGDVQVGGDVAIVVGDGADDLDGKEAAHLDAHVGFLQRLAGGCDGGFLARINDTRHRRPSAVIGATHA